MKFHSIEVYVVCNLLAVFFKDPRILEMAYMFMAVMSTIRAFFSEETCYMTGVGAVDYSFAVYLKTGGVFALLAHGGFVNFNPYLNNIIIFALDVVVEIVKNNNQYGYIDKDDIKHYIIGSVIMFISLYTLFIIDKSDLFITSFLILPTFLDFIGVSAERFFIQFVIFVVLSFVSVFCVHRDYEDYDDAMEQVGNKVINSTDNYFGKMPLKIWKTLNE